ncbi:MAG: phosphodiester glycosidase family protein [Verrucomicrobiaceae bacterium]|nr:phosphodiester glycosidase family protein [Verrucomicrobiaceae bacterium]
MKLLVTIVLALCSTTQAVDFKAIVHAGKKFTVCRVDLRKEKLQLFLKDDQDQPLRSFATLDAWLQKKGEKLTLAMNAGMYHGDFSPVGLCVADRKQLAPVNLANGEGNFFLKPNGIFLISDQGAKVIKSEEYPTLKEKVELATQSGPLLLRNGVEHPAFNPESKNQLFRNGVGVASPHEVIFAISEEIVSFHELATLFRDVLKCPDALFLDGTVSSLYAPPLKRSDKKMDLGPMIGVTTKP